jgi:hypothetical protein
MTHYADPKRVTARKALIQSLRAATSKRLMQRDKFEAAAPQSPPDRPRADTPAERHRAWLRQVARHPK